MNENETKDVLIFESNCSYELKIENEKLQSGEGKIQLKETEFLISPKLKEPILISFIDIACFYEQDYKVVFVLTSNETLIVYDLGYKFGDFLRIFSRLYNDFILKRLLMQETLKKSGIEAEMIIIDNIGRETKIINCNPRLYETGIVLIPEKGELKRIPYSDIREIKEEDYKLIIETEFNEKIILSMMGRDFEPFVNAISQTINELALKVQGYLKELLPDANNSVIRRISKFMKEGRAAKREDIEAISNDVWNQLERKIKNSDIKEEYEFLKAMSYQKKICIGMKRDLLGDLTGEYIWFLLPIVGAENKKYGNAIAMEAISGEEGGKATYFFRIMSRQEYNKIHNKEIEKKIEDFIYKINRCMLAINFRREPIYLSDEKLQEPQYQKYNYAIAKIPELKELRNLFIGRVIHSSVEQWKKDVMDLMEFNVNEKNDDLKWKKGG